MTRLGLADFIASSTITAVNRRWWATPHHKNHPITVPENEVSHTWQGVVFEGDDTVRRKWVDMGTETVTVTSPYHTVVYGTAPYYVPVTLDGATWHVALGVSVTIPLGVGAVLRTAQFTVA